MVLVVMFESGEADFNEGRGFPYCERRAWLYLTRITHRLTYGIGRM